MGDSEEDLQNMVDKVNEAGKLHSRKINAKKTKAKVISRNENKSKVNIKVDGESSRTSRKLQLSGSNFD